MKTIVYSAKDFEIPFLEEANDGDHELVFVEAPLSAETVSLAKGAEAVFVFTADDCSAPVLESLHQYGVPYLIVRAAGHDNIDLVKANELGIRVANVPSYSPYAIAEHAVALLLALNRKIILADQQVHASDFRVSHLVGFDLHGKTAGIVGTGGIGSKMAGILHGFGCKLLAFDLNPDTTLTQKFGVQFMDLASLCQESDVISIHLPLNAASRYLINKSYFNLMKKGVVLLNTSRGAVVHTADLLIALKNQQVGAYGADVYENEKGVFFFDRSSNPPKDPMLQELLALPNVLITPHQAFATRDALTNIADTVLESLNAFEKKEPCANELTEKTNLNPPNIPPAV